MSVLANDNISARGGKTSLQSGTENANSNSENDFGIVVPKPSGNLDEPTKVFRCTYFGISKETSNVW